MEYLLIFLVFVAGWLLIAYSRPLADFIHLVFGPPPPPPPPTQAPPAPEPPKEPTAAERLAALDELMKQNEQKRRGS